MTAAGPGVEHFLSSFAAREAALPGSDVAWLRSTRRQAIGRFAALGFPTQRDEDWKYTSVRAIEKRPFEMLQAAGRAVTQAEVEGFLPWDVPCRRLVFVDGCYDPARSAADGAQAGITVTSLAAAVRSEADALEPYLNRSADASGSAFAALNTAFMGDGAYVRLSAGAVGESPIHLLFVSTGRADVVYQPRTLVVAEAGSSAVLVESYVTVGGGSYFTNTATEVVLEAGSEIEHYKLQEESEDAHHVATLQVLQRGGSRFVSHSLSLGGRLSRNDINVLLDAEDAACTLNGLYVARGRQHVDYHTRVDHARPRGTSEAFYKGILDGRGRGVFNGRVYVHADAQRTDARQSNHNLVLSRGAEVDTKPQLEIYADDVKCSHGATVGRLDPTMLYYLRSRGVEEATARAMLTFGFAEEMIERMGLAAVRAHVADALAKRLPALAPIGS